MLVNRKIFGKSQKIYICDRCRTFSSSENKVAIYIGLPSRQPKKKWDLCRKCFRSLVRGIEKE